MNYGLVTKLTALAILTFSLKTASALKINITAPAGPSHPVTVSVDDLAPFVQLRYQFSENGANWHYLDNTGQWWDKTNPVYNCTPAGNGQVTHCEATFRRPVIDGDTFMVRVVVMDARGGWHFGKNSIESVTWPPSPPVQRSACGTWNWNNRTGWTTAVLFRNETASNAAGGPCDGKATGTWSQSGSKVTVIWTWTCSGDKSESRDELELSADGKKLTMPGDSGWRPAKRTGECR